MGRSSVRRVVAFLAPRAGVALVMCMLVISGGCESTRLVIEPGQYFLQYTLHSVDGVHLTTNYRSGATMPINTEVELLESGEERLVLRTKDDRTLVVQNDHRQTGGALYDAFVQVLGREPVELAEFEPGVRYAIRVGQVLPGMTRKAVLAAIGPPPQIGTVSLNQVAWKYWSEPNKAFHVRFDRDGRVLEVR